MEQHFGHDFSQVQVHSGSAAEQSARDVNAYAYTVGHHIVFGAGQFKPGAHQGQRLIAHELTHVVQQGGDRENGQSVARLQRLPNWVRVIFGLAGTDTRLPGTQIEPSAGDFMHGIAGLAGVGFQLSLIEQWYNNPRNKQFINDLIVSVKESPQHVGEFFEGEVWEAIKEHWGRIVLVTGGLLLAEAIIAGLAAAPEPTMLTKVIAVILQIIVIAILGYYVAVEAVGAYEEGRNWFAIARRANGDPAVITEASRSFVRIVLAHRDGGPYASWRAREGSGIRSTKRCCDWGRRSRHQGVVQVQENLVTSRHSLATQGIDPALGPRLRVSLLRTMAVAQHQRSSHWRHQWRHQWRHLHQCLRQHPLLPRVLHRLLHLGRACNQFRLQQQVSPPQHKRKKRPPFVLKLPMEKAPHLATYRSWLGVLQSDPNYVRGNPAQLDKWHQAHRQGGSHPIPRSVYERGHALGLTGEEGEERIRVPDWSRRSKSIFMQVDHIIELQLTPNSHRGIFDKMDNYELLDRRSNVNSRNRLVGNIRSERAMQEAFDPSVKGRILLFDDVTLDGGTESRWISDEIRAGEQLDAFEEHGK